MELKIIQKRVDDWISKHGVRYFDPLTNMAQLTEEVGEVARIISAKSNLSIKIGKKAFYKQLEMPLKKAYAYTSKMMTLNMMSMDAREGISAFLEKRKPNWKNK